MSIYFEKEAERLSKAMTDYMKRFYILSLKRQDAFVRRRAIERARRRRASSRRLADTDKTVSAHTIEYRIQQLSKRIELFNTHA